MVRKQIHESGTIAALTHSNSQTSFIVSPQLGHEHQISKAKQSQIPQILLDFLLYVATPIPWNGFLLYLKLNKKKAPFHQGASHEMRSKKNQKKIHGIACDGTLGWQGML